MSNVEIKVAIQNFTKVLAIQVVMCKRVQVNPNGNTTASRIRDLRRINPPTL